MSGYIVNIEDATATNVDYRRVLFTAKHTQLVLMNLKPGEEIGEEVHELDQFIRFEAGEGSVVLDGKAHSVSDGFAVVIPAGTRHNVMNRSKSAALELYSLYSPPEHRDGIVHKTKAGSGCRCTSPFRRQNVCVTGARKLNPCAER